MSDLTVARTEGFGSTAVARVTETAAVAVAARAKAAVVATCDASGASATAAITGRTWDAFVARMSDHSAGSLAAIRVTSRSP